MRQYSVVNVAIDEKHFRTGGDRITEKVMAIVLLPPNGEIGFVRQVRPGVDAHAVEEELVISTFEPSPAGDGLQIVGRKKTHDAPTPASRCAIAFPAMIRSSKGRLVLPMIW